MAPRLDAPRRRPAAAQQSGGDEVAFVTNAWAKPELCNLGNALRLTFDAARPRQRALNGQCVAIMGYWRSNALYADASHARLGYPPSSEANDDARIGLYGQWDRLGRMPPRPLRVTAVGLFSNCDRWNAATMVMGYCHYSGGPIIILSQIVRP